MPGFRISSSAARRVATPQFAPGPRLSALDVAVLVTAGVASVICAVLAGWIGLAIAFVVGYFFLFCNVFRVSRSLELLWSAVFILLVLGTSFFDRPGWLITIAAAAGTSVLVIAWEIRKPSYHGIGWQWINPGLRRWWQSHVADQ